MDRIDQLVAVMTLGVVAAALFAVVVGTLRRGLDCGIMCGYFAVVQMVVLLSPLWLPLLSITYRLS